MALGLTHDDPLPDVSRKTLLAYHRYLAANLEFPFTIKARRGRASVTVRRLVDPTEYDLEEDEGLLCETRSREGPFDIPLSEIDNEVRNKLIGDYRYWFHNWR